MLDIRADIQAEFKISVSVSVMFVRKKFARLTHKYF